MNENEYKIIFDGGEYNLYDDIIIKYELLLKKEISKKDLDKVLEENNKLKAYYGALKLIKTKLRTEKEIKKLLENKDFKDSDINYAILRLNKEGYLNHEIYIEAYIHDVISFNLVGERKILNDLLNLGFKEEEIRPFLEKVEHNIYLDKIEKYINKKIKSNKKSVKEFKMKIVQDLMNKGFYKEDILNILDNINMEDNMEDVKLLVNKLYKKYQNKYDENTIKFKIKNYLYQKGYIDIDVDNLME